MKLLLWLFVAAALLTLQLIVYYYEFHVLDTYLHSTSATTTTRVPAVTNSENSNVDSAEQHLQAAIERSKSFKAKLTRNKKSKDTTTTKATKKTKKTTTTTTTRTTTKKPTKSKPTTTKSTTTSTARPLSTRKTTFSNVLETKPRQAQRNNKADKSIDVTPWPTLVGAPAEYTIALAHDNVRGEAEGGHGFRKLSVAQMEQRMQAAEDSGLVEYEFPVAANARPANGVKICGAVAVRNVAENVGQFLKLLAKLTDAILVLDDCSSDRTVSELRRAARDVQLEAIIRKTEWLRNEAQDKNLLFRLGRTRLQCTAFMVPDYDETFSHACLHNDYLRKIVATSLPGTKIGLHWKEYWGSLDAVRIDPKQPSQNFLNRMIPIIFVDRTDRPLYVPEKDRPLKIHYARIPMQTGGPVTFVDDRRCVIVEFRFVSLVNVYLKRIWYACFGALHGTAKLALGRMNRLMDEEPLLDRADATWLTDDAREFAESFQLIEAWRVKQICHWIAAYGSAPFVNVDMWTIDWLALAKRFEADENASLTLDDFRNVNFTAQSSFMDKIYHKKSARQQKPMDALEATMKEFAHQ